MIWRNELKTLVIYDSVYGNTEQIAEAIGKAINADVSHINKVNVLDMKTYDLIILGSPTHGGRPSPAMRNFLDKAPNSSFKDKKVAAFGTRLQTKLVRIFGYAANRIGDRLKKKGGTLVVPPEGFYVNGPKGPVKDGELQRAESWAKRIS